MSKFTLEIACDNAAFDDDVLPEVGRILEALATKLKRTTTTGAMWGGLRDGNGNRVGAWDYSTGEH